MGFKRTLVQDETGLVGKAGQASGLLSNIQPVLIATDANATITPAQMQAGSVVFTGFSAGRNLTTPTATVLGAAFPSMDIGDSVSFFVSCVAAFAGTWVAGASVTLKGRATTPASSYSLVSCVKTAAATYDWVVH